MTPVDLLEVILKAMSTGLARRGETAEGLYLGGRLRQAQDKSLASDLGIIMSTHVRGGKGVEILVGDAQPLCSILPHRSDLVSL